MLYGSINYINGAMLSKYLILNTALIYLYTDVFCHYLAAQPFGSTALWQHSPLVAQPFGSTALWQHSPLVAQTFGSTDLW